jgi:2-polyprenyl-3-methyl-5-hydroxy-6-metoxy-1,4-benzoquinol methylase
VSAVSSKSELWDLENLARATRLGDWMFEQFADLATGHVVEVGAGIGTFSGRMLANGVSEALLIEPDAGCATRLEERFGHDGRVVVSRETVPGSQALAARTGKVDFLLCQNVLEHIEDDYAAVRAMADAVAPGRALGLLVPAHPRLYGALDERFGHERRYTRERLRTVVEAAGLTVEALYSFNMLGVLGWVVNSRRRAPKLDPRSLKAYELMLPPFRALERRRRPRFGLSLVVRARRPALASSAGDVGP